MSISPFQWLIYHAQHEWLHFKKCRCTVACLSTYKQVTANFSTDYVCRLFFQSCSFFHIFEDHMHICVLILHIYRKGHKIFLHFGLHLQTKNAFLPSKKHQKTPQTGNSLDLFGFFDILLATCSLDNLPLPNLSL